MDEVSEGLYTGAHSFTFSERTWGERAKGLFGSLRHEGGAFIATALALWGIAGVIAAATNERLPLERLAVPVLVTALVVALYRAYRREMTYVPEVLESETSTVKDLFRKQRYGWNAAMSREMLQDRIGSAEATLSRIAQGAEYVAPRRVDVSEYMVWVRGRPDAMLRLIRAAMVLVSQQLPMAIGQTTSEGDLAALKREIDALARVYNAARDLEIECYQVAPPSGFEAVHEMSYGWTSTIRKAVRDFCDILQSVEQIDRKALIRGEVSPPSFSITVAPPPNLEEFSERLEEATS